jgi:hypothetical protein
MKKYLILLLLTGCSIVTFGQAKDFKTELYIGATGGMTFTKVRFYPNLIESFHEGKAGGIMFRLISEPHIGFQVEVNYTQKGWKEDSVGYSRQLNYISFPVMTHINLGQKAVRFTLNFGPEMAYMMSESEKFTPQKTVVSGDPYYREYFGKPTDTQLDFLFTAGIGMEYHLKGGGALALEGRAFYSLPNLFDTKTYSYKVSQLNGAQVKLAYMFQLNKKRTAKNE